MSIQLSIITITYQAEKVLERTLQSVANQTASNFEYLIMDGGSRDATLALVKKYNRIVTRCVSEPDKGIYDAMNKGLALAQGEYVWFMNAGDELHDNRAVERLLKKMSVESADVYYSDALFVNDYGSSVGLRSKVTPHRLPNPLSWKNMQLGMVVCHQAFIVRKSIAPFYDLEHHYSADIDWEIKCLKAGNKAIMIEPPLAKYLTGGFSVKNLRKSLWDRFMILRRHFGLSLTLWNHVRIVWRGVLFSVKRKGKYW